MSRSELQHLFRCRGTSSRTEDVLFCVRPDQLLTGFLSTVGLRSWAINFCLDQLSADVQLLHGTRTCGMVRPLCLMLACRHCPSRTTTCCLPFPSLFSMHEYSSSKTTLFHRIVSVRTDTIENRPITTSHLIIVVVCCSKLTAHLFDPVVHACTC